MNLYLNDKERSLKFLKLLEVMLRDLMTSSNIELSDTNLIDETKGIIDPVQDFLEYYVKDASLEDEFDEGRLAYIKNALYAAKGAPQVFEIYSECFGTQLGYEYPFPQLKLVTFSQLKVSDVILYITKFKGLLYNLLYYTELTLEIRNLALNIIGELSQVSHIGVKGFREAVVELDQDGF